MMKLVVGLGNPGLYYTHTRHNVGFRTINKIAKLTHIEIKGRKYKSRIGQGKILDKEVILAKPMTYVNLSGEAVGLMIRKFQVNLSDLLVVYDDVSLEVGKIRIRKKGSAGGHNGMNSIIKVLATEEFPRIRIGIGSPPSHISFRDYVLSRFTQEEEKIIEQAIEKASQCIIWWIEESIDAAMNKLSLFR